MRKWFILLPFLLIVGVGVIAGNYFVSLRNLQIRIDPGAVGTVSKVYTLAEFTGPDLGVGKSVKYGQSMRLKKGEYVVVTEGKEFNRLVTNVSLDNDKEVYVSPDYTDVKLEAMLRKELGIIRAMLRKELPLTKLNFELDRGRMYKTGQWYGTKVSTRLSESEKQLTYTDYYKIVAKKENGKWVIVTKPPELIISKVKYPQIPRDILVDINKNPQ